MNLRNILSQRIKEARLEVDISQDELANQVGLSDKSISAYEVGRTEPSLPTLQLIAQATHKPMSFFTDENPQDYTIETKLSKIESELEAVKELLKRQV